MFNIIAGAAAIPQDLKYTSALLGIKGWERWRTLILPALFPIHHHRRDHCQRRRVECQHRR